MDARKKCKIKKKHRSDQTKTGVTPLFHNIPTVCKYIPIGMS